MKKRKRILGICVSLALGFLLGEFLVAIMSDDVIDLYNRGYSEAAVGLIWLAMLYAAYFVQVIMHETGHMVFALLTGYKFVSFRVLHFVWVKTNDGIRLKRYWLPGTLGQCLMDPPEMEDGNYPGMLYHMGGVIMDMAVFAVCAVMWYILAWKYWMAGTMIMYLAFQATFALYSALMNGIPAVRGMICNDGYNALKLQKNHDAMRALWIQLKVNAAEARGVKLADMPDEWFEMPTDEQMKNHHIAWLALIRLDRLYEMLQLDKAVQLVDHLMDAPIELRELHRRHLICEKMFLEAIGENRSEVIDALRTKEQLTYMKKMKSKLTVLRAKYAFALLVKQDEKQAMQIRERFAKIGKNYPFPEIFASECRMMKLVDQKKNEIRISQPE